MVELLERIKVDAETIRSIKEQIQHSAFDISIVPSESLWNISSIGSVVSVNAISKEYSNSLYSDQCGMIKEQFEKTLKAVRMAMWEVEERIDNYNKLLKIDDPNEYIREFKSLMEDEYPFYRASWGKAGGALKEVQYLEDGLNDINDFMEFIKQKNIYEWAINVFAQVDGLAAQISETLKFGNKERYIFYINLENKLEKSRLYISEDRNPETVFNLDMPAKIEWPRHTETIDTRRVIDRIRHDLRNYLDKKYDFEAFLDLKHGT